VPKQGNRSRNNGSRLVGPTSSVIVVGGGGAGSSAELGPGDAVLGVNVSISRDHFDMVDMPHHHLACPNAEPIPNVPINQSIDQ
jgi:hypothetical protein